MSRVYLDMDGVLFDFDKGLLDQYGIVNCKINYATDWKEKTDEQRKVAHDVIRAMEDPGFFYSLPLMRGAMDLWNSVPEPWILTATPNLACDARVAREKKQRVREVFGEEAEKRTIVCLRSEKVRYARDLKTCTSHILVDDLERNVNEWEQAFGIGILFNNSQQAISDLKKVINV